MKANMENVFGLLRRHHGNGKDMPPLPRSRISEVLFR